MVYEFVLAHAEAEFVAPAVAVTGLMVRPNVAVATAHGPLLTVMVSVIRPPMALSLGPKT